MTAEQRLKNLIGEQAFQICILQDQLDQANAKLAGLTSALAEANGKSAQAGPSNP